MIYTNLNINIKHTHMYIIFIILSFNMHILQIYINYYAFYLIVNNNI
jgi:hypothetical protein